MSSVDEPLLYKSSSSPFVLYPALSRIVWYSGSFLMRSNFISHDFLVRRRACRFTPGSENGRDVWTSSTYHLDVMVGCSNRTQLDEFKLLGISPGRRLQIEVNGSGGAGGSDTATTKVMASAGDRASARDTSACDSANGSGCDSDRGRCRTVQGHLAGGDGPSSGHVAFRKMSGFVEDLVALACWRDARVDNATLQQQVPTVGADDAQGLVFDACALDGVARPSTRQPAWSSKAFLRLDSLVIHGGSWWGLGSVLDRDQLHFHQSFVYVALSCSSILVRKVDHDPE